MGSILVIEDEKGILGLIEAALTRFGHQVETAEDGKEGIRKFDRGSFDMVITDYVMPEVDGEGVLDHIRRSSRHRTPDHRHVGDPLAAAGRRLRPCPGQTVSVEQAGGVGQKPLTCK